MLWHGFCYIKLVLKTFRTHIVSTCTYYTLIQRYPVMDTQRNKIIQLACERFKQYGIRSVSIDDLCRELGMSKKTFYVYFKQKDELVLAVLHTIHETHSANIEHTFSGKSTLECVRQMMDFMQSFSEVHQEPPFAYDLQKYYPDIYREHIDKVRRITRDFITSHIEQGIAEGVYRNDLDIEMCSIFFVLMQQAYIQNINHIHTVSPKRVATFTIDSFLRTVLSEEGLRKVDQMRKQN